MAAIWLQEYIGQKLRITGGIDGSHNQPIHGVLIQAFGDPHPAFRLLSVEGGNTSEIIINARNHSWWERCGKVERESTRSIEIVESFQALLKSLDKTNVTVVDIHGRPIQGRLEGYVLSPIFEIGISPYQNSGPTIGINWGNVFYISAERERVGSRGESESVDRTIDDDDDGSEPVGVGARLLPPDSGQTAKAAAEQPSAQPLRKSS